MIELLCERFEIDGTVRVAAQRAQAHCERRISGATRRQSNVMRAFLDEGVARATSRVRPATATTTRRATLRIAARAHLRRGACLARLSIVSGTHAIVNGARRVRPARSTLLSSPGGRTIRCATRSATSRVRWSGKASLSEIALRRTAASTSMRSMRPSRRRASRPSFCSARAATRRGRRSRRRATTAFARVSGRAARRGPRRQLLRRTGRGARTDARGGGPHHGVADQKSWRTIAPAGGYVAGRAELVERRTALRAGIPTGLGPTLGYGARSCKGCSSHRSSSTQALPDSISPQHCSTNSAIPSIHNRARRTDIVQAIRLGEPAAARFAAGLQTAMPINARFRPNRDRFRGTSIRS